METISILSVFGTRPEAIKMAPVLKIMDTCGFIESKVCVTAQHRQMLDQVLDIFNIVPDYDLNIMTKNQNLASITTSALNGLVDTIAHASPDLILVHGDTTTTMAASLAAFYCGVKLGHVEAGLRSGNKAAPFPEEINRKIAACIADLNFAPTMGAKKNLLNENIANESIFVTGNTAIDAIDSLVTPLHNFKNQTLANIDYTKGHVITITAHRRENYGKPLRDICNAIKMLAKCFSNVQFVWPVHMAPAVMDVSKELLGSISNVHLIEPVDIKDLLNLISKSYMVLTDSGGIQEEAPYLNKPVLVLRDVTERPEGLDTGCLALTGTNSDKIYNMAAKLLSDKAHYNKMANAKNPFGDACASPRILAAILYHFGFNDTPPEDFAI